MFKRSKKQDGLRRRLKLLELVLDARGHDLRQAEHHISQLQARITDLEACRADDRATADIRSAMFAALEDGLRKRMTRGEKRVKALDKFYIATQQWFEADKILRVNSKKQESNQ